MRSHQKLNPPKPKPEKPPRVKAPVRGNLVDGRPSKRTDTARTRIIEAIKQGNSFAGAAKYAGMSENSFREWRRDDVELSEACDQAREEMKVAMLAVISRAAVNDKQWQAAAWKLERIFPEEFGRKFQPVPLLNESTPDSAPGKLYRVAIEPVPDLKAAA
jgi:hypothetical protein